MIYIHRRPSPTPAHDPLSSARGVLVGIVLGALCWFVILALLLKVLW